MELNRIQLNLKYFWKIIDMQEITIILTVDLNKQKNKFLAVLKIMQEANNNLEDKIKIETEKQISFINNIISDSTDERGYMICMLLRYPNGVILPYGFPAFGPSETDAIVEYVRSCFELMTFGGMPVSYENNYFSDNRLLCFAVGAMCDIQMLERALADAESNVQRH